MGSSIITITGNVTADPQVHEFDTGTRKSKFSVACTPSVRDRNTGEYSDGTTTFYDVECWNRLAHNATVSLHKGDPVVVTGRLSVETWQGQDGGRRQSVIITASAVGHDLARGTALFERQQQAPVQSAPDDGADFSGPSPASGGVVAEDEEPAA